MCCWRHGLCCSLIGTFIWRSQGMCCPYFCPTQATGPAFTADDFPSLGGPTAASSTNSQAGSTAGYASKARAAAELPTQPRSSGGAGARQRPTAAAAAAAERAAPIWQAQGVHQFATGAAAAQEYAELRSEARDHARLRNAYFQQVGAGCALVLAVLRGCRPWLAAALPAEQGGNLRLLQHARCCSQAGCLGCRR